MENPDLLLIVVLKALVEVAALSILAQGILRILAGRAYQQNFAYRLFQIVAQPALSAARLFTPRFIGQQYLGLVAFLLLLWLWLLLIYAKAHICQARHLACLAG